jgi:hypothetical protein
MYSGEWAYEDNIYRFYHQSAKIFYRVQRATKDILAALQSVFPDRQLNKRFLAIVREGTGRAFGPETNAHWMEQARPIVEAFFHAHFFLSMVVKYSRLPSAPDAMPAGWAAIEYLYRWVDDPV